MPNHDTESPELPLQVLGLFRIIFKSSNKHFEAIEKSVGVSGAQLWALSEIAQAGGLKVSELAKAMSLHQSTTSNLIEKMEANGLVTRVRSTEDRRVVQVRATAAGQAMLNKAPGPVRGLLPDALMRMPPAELEALKSHLDAVLQLMESKSDRYALEPLGMPITFADK